jgi:hypothetical protein
VSVLHVAVSEEAELFLWELERRFQPVEMMITECSPVIGAANRISL